MSSFACSVWHDLVSPTKRLTVHQYKRELGQNASTHSQIIHRFFCDSAFTPRRSLTDFVSTKRFVPEGFGLRGGLSWVEKGSGTNSQMARRVLRTIGS